MASAEEMKNRSPVDVDCESSVDAQEITTEVVSFVEKTHPSRETHLGRTLILNPSESVIASWARLIPVSLLTRFSLICRMDGTTLVARLEFLNFFWLFGFSNFFGFFF